MTLLSNWHFMRILRAGIAVWAISEYFGTNDFFMLTIGGLFGFLAIFDVGCCGPSGCTTSPKTQKQEFSAQEINYEEVK